VRKELGLRGSPQRAEYREKNQKRGGVNRGGTRRKRKKFKQGGQLWRGRGRGENKEGRKKLGAPVTKKKEQKDAVTTKTMVVKVEKERLGVIGDYVYNGEKHRWRKDHMKDHTHNIKNEGIQNLGGGCPGGRGKGRHRSFCRWGAKVIRHGTPKGQRLGGVFYRCGGAGNHSVSDKKTVTFEKP